MECVYKSINTNTDDKAKTQQTHVHITWDAVHAPNSCHDHRVFYWWIVSIITTHSGLGIYIICRLVQVVLSKQMPRLMRWPTERTDGSIFYLTISVHIYPSACLSLHRRNLPAYVFVNTNLCIISSNGLATPRWWKTYTIQCYIDTIFVLIHIFFLEISN